MFGNGKCFEHLHLEQLDDVYILPFLPTVVCAVHA
jgi:hypothetical protein